MSVLKDLKTPVFYTEGMQDIDPGAWRLAVDGLVEQERAFTLDELRSMPRSTADARLTSVSGWSVRATWGGVLFAQFLEHLSRKPRADHIIFTSAGFYETCVALSYIKDHARVLICYEVNGEPLEPEYGGPVRVFIPHLWGYKSCKGLARITFTDHMHGGYWEDRGYPRTAPIQPGVTFDINTRERRPISGGEVDEF
jgi:DMSO/TMAO reductase YedYZ molybdopterin-dependent catalytic subunit